MIAGPIDDVRSLAGVDTNVAGGRDHWKLLPSNAWLLGWRARKAGLSWACALQCLPVAFSCVLGFLTVWRQDSEELPKKVRSQTVLRGNTQKGSLW